MKYEFWMPGENGIKKEYLVDKNALIIVGANGAGKSHLAAWIEKQDGEKVHRIGAQRNINFNENISLKSYDQAESLVFYGDDKNKTKSARWNYGKEYTTKLLNDFDYVLAALIAKKSNQESEFFEQCREAEKTGKEKPFTPQTVLDQLELIWDTIFPQRKIVLQDAKFYGEFNDNGEVIKYPANKMSDGERSVLYHAAQVLCVPKDKILIIDEPEIHLHRSIMNTLWSLLEQQRRDCLFVYVTHDTDFAAMHASAQKIWIKSFDGKNNWEWQDIDNKSLPEELLLSILGSRKSVIFVEGDKSSYDSKIYEEYYPNYFIIPCGSCTQVIARTKAFRANANLHSCEVFGIIDKDYRSDYEIEQFKKDNIYVLPIAEVENLFIVEEIVKLIAEHLGKNSDEIFIKIESWIRDRFRSQLDSQINKSVIADIKYRLQVLEIDQKKVEDTEASISKIIGSINSSQIVIEHKKKFSDAANAGYREILSIFNEKSLLREIGNFYGLRQNEYQTLVLDLFRGKLHEEIKECLSNYLPTL